MLMLGESEDNASEEEEDLRPAIPMLTSLLGADEESSSDDDAAPPKSEEAAPSHALHADAAHNGATSELPSADDFDSLAQIGGAFLNVTRGPAGAENASWKLTPAELAEAELAARREAREAQASSSLSLPMNRYGRGLNMLQLTVELSGRAARGSGGEGSGKRKAAEHAPPRAANDLASADATSAEESSSSRKQAKGRGNNRTALEEGWT